MIRRIEQCALGYRFETGAQAEKFLLANGWEYFHAGNWHHAKQPGVIREIRRPNQGAFIIVQTRQATEAPNA